MSRWSDVGREFAAIPGEVLRRGADAKLEEGFNAAASICVDLLSKKIEVLMGQMRTGELSRPEQLLLSSLTDLKAETEQSFYGYWEVRAESE